MNPLSIVSEYWIPFGNLDAPKLDYRADGFIYLVFGSIDAPIGKLDKGATFFLREDQVAWMLISQADPERAKSQFWKYEDWDTLEMESEMQ